MPAEQLPFDLGSRSAYGREDFWVSACNAEAVAWLDRWPDWPGPLLVLTGPEGSGKTHLTHVFRQRVGDGAVIRDDIDRLLGDAAGYQLEQDLFHAWTRARDQGQPLLLTAQKPPAAWGIRLEDLRSRVAAAPLVRLGAPDDELMAVVMTKMFADRQLFVPQDVVSYMLKRIERSFTAIGRMVAAVDARALAEKRAVTIPLVRDLLPETSSAG